MTVAVQTVTKSREDETEFARNAIISAFAASRLVTAAAHSDAYPRFGIELLSGFSSDLICSLERSADALERACES